MTRKVLIFGAGEIGTRVIKALSYDGTIEIIGILDNDKNKVGNQILGYNSYQPKEYLIHSGDNRSTEVIIAVGKLYLEEVKEQLYDLGYQNLIHYAELYCKKTSSREIMDQNVMASSAMDDKVSIVKRSWMNHLDGWYTYNRDKKFSIWIPKGAKVLDVGHGCGKELFHLLSNGYDAYGIDCCQWKMDFCRRKIVDYCFPKEWEERFLFGYGEELPFEDELFDMVISCYVLEHVYDVKKCVHEMLRVIKKGGALRINAPDYNNSFEEHYYVDFGKPIKGNEVEFGNYLQQNNYNMEIYNELNFIDNNEIFDILNNYGMEKISKIVDYNQLYPNTDGTRRIDLLIVKA